MEPGKPGAAGSTVPADSTGPRSARRTVLTGGGMTLGLLASPPGAAGDGSGSMAVPQDPPGITVVGDGLIRVKPDSSTLSLGVQSTASTASEALSVTRQMAERVVQQLRTQGVAEGDLQTSGLNVYPIEGRTKEGTFDPTSISGYRGSATISVKVTDASRVGGLLDAGMQAGATAVQGLMFGLRDDAAWRLKALAAAIDDARRKARAVADATGLPLGGIRAVAEQPILPPGGLSGLGGGGGGAGEGLAPGELSIPARVQVTFDVST